MAEVTSAKTPRWRIALLALPLLFYLGLPTRNFYWDGVAFAINIENRASPALLLHPNHLVYTIFGAWLFQCTEAIGIHTRALFVLQTANSVMAGLSVFLLYKYLRIKAIPAGLAMPASLIFGFSATWWKFAADADAYVPSIFLLLCASVLMEDSKWVFFAGLAQAGAALFHELAVLFFLVAFLRLRKSPRSAAVYAVAAFVPLATAYFLAYRVVARQEAIPSFASWIVSHSPDSGFFFNPVTNLGLSIRGSLRLFFGGRLGDYAGGVLSGLALVGLVIAVAGFVYCLGRKGAGTIGFSRPPIDLLAWAGIYVAFLFFWMPQNTFYRLFYLAPLIAIVFVLLRDAPRRAVWMFLSVLVTWNFAFDIYPQSRPDFNAPLHFALSQQRTWTAGTPILYGRFHPDLWTISYFSWQAAWIEIQQAGPAQLDQILATARRANNPVWMEETAYQLTALSRDGKRWLAEHEQTREFVEYKDDRHDFRFHCFR